MIVVCNLNLHIINPRSKCVSHKETAEQRKVRTLGLWSVHVDVCTESAKNQYF